MRQIIITLALVSLLAYRAEKSTVLVEETPKLIEKDTTETIFCYVDSLCGVLCVPYGLVYAIGENETGWRNIDCYDTSEKSTGHLQINEICWKEWAPKLGLKEKTEKNLILVGIVHLRYQYERYRNWEKARFAYARGHWRPSSTWKPIEKRFMKKVNWSKFTEADNYYLIQTICSRRDTNSR